MRARRSRQKTFTVIGSPLDKNGRARLLTAARSLSRRQRTQHHDGPMAAQGDASVRQKPILYLSPGALSAKRPQVRSMLEFA